MAAAKPAEPAKPKTSKYKVLRGKVSQDGKCYRAGETVTMEDTKAAVTQDGMLKKV